MRATIASAVALAILALVSGLPLDNCPFLVSSAHAKPCCPREAPKQGSKCPLSPTLETCPYFITDSKLGVIEARVLDALAPGAALIGVSIVASDQPISSALHEWVPSQTDLYIRIRVLLI